ncbi:MAG: PTS transporter subunit EIIC, partial [Clostridiales bacterium]|nr:PTS transporter subunit EIIC [Clostridiales bacterium]
MEKTNNTNGQTFRVKLQRFGSFLSSMIMPNILAFIAWGILAALFIPTGWLPNENFNEIVGPTLNYLLPLLVAYTGGKAVYDTRGGVVAAMVTMGLIVGADVTMFLGAMVIGPTSAYLMKQVDNLYEGKVPAGFEMLVRNFSAGIFTAIVTLLCYVGIGPVFTALNNILTSGVNFLMSNRLIPLVSIFMEPAKVLFLNNAVNFGVLTPIGLEQVAEAGRSMMFAV